MKSFALASLVFAAPGLAQITLGAAQAFALLAIESITNTGDSTVVGTVGSINGGVIGFPATVGPEVNGAAAEAANVQVNVAYNAARNLTTDQILGNTALDVPITLTPGVYAFEQGASIAAEVTLSGAGQFIFNIPSNLAVVAGGSVVLADGATAENVFWTLGRELIMESGGQITGNVITDVFITLEADASVTGALFAGTTITVDDSSITNPSA